MKVFVYGTLRTGGPLHYIMGRAHSICLAETKDADYAMLHLTYYPGVVRHPNGIKIKGELFEGDDSLLEALDRVEGYPRLYTREEITVVCDGVEHTAWIYLYNHGSDGKARRYITTGEWVQ